MTIAIESFDSQKHKRSEFCCGQESLDKYIRQQASQDIKKKVATVFVLVDSPETEILAYYTLSSYTVEIAELNQEFTKRLPRYPLLPATLLGRLAVDSRYQGQGFGELMLIDALNQSLKTTSVVASLAVVVEALDAEVVKFYQRFGFQQFKQHPIELYLPMKLIEKMCKNTGI